MYNKIYDFCKVKSVPVHSLGLEPSPRVKFLTKLCDDNGLKYELDIFPFDKKTNLYNIVLLGNSDKMLIAHHDIVNPNSDNANDDSASVINCLAIKKMRPDVNVVITDCEECGTRGAAQLAKRIKAGDYGTIAWVLNLELTGKGGESFFMGNYPGALYNLLLEKFNPLVVNTPPNDSIILRNNSIDSVVVTTLPKRSDEDLKKLLAKINKEEQEDNERPEFTYGDYWGGINSFNAFNQKKKKRKLLKPKPGFKFWGFEFDTGRKEKVETPEEKEAREKIEQEKKEADKIKRIEKNKVRYDEQRGKAAMNFAYLWYCHSMKDSLSSIDPADMKIFSENVVLKLL
jgi:hypothetical protein